MSKTTGKKIHPAFWVPTLYTAEGLPFVIVNVVSVLMYKSLGFPMLKLLSLQALLQFPGRLSLCGDQYLKCSEQKRILL